MLKQEPILSDITWSETYQHYNNCRLCWAKSKLGKLYPENTVLYSSDHFITIPAVGSLISCYLLMVSRKHMRSLATLNKSELAIVEKELGKLLHYLKPISKQWMIFEHGNMKHLAHSSSCCIDHFHLHVLPLDEEQSNLIINIISRDLEIKAKIHSLEDFHEYKGKNLSNYILLRTPDGSFKIFSSSNIPSQYIRKIIAEAYDSETTWNWRIHSNTENIKFT